MRVKGCLSERRLSSIGSPQGGVLSPLLYILYTNDCRSQHGNRHVLKFADNTVISFLHKNKSEHGSVVEEFVQWCDKSFLLLNPSKTKDMVIDLRRTQTCSTLPTNIKRSQIEFTDQYKYLGTVIDNKLKCGFNSQAVYRKGQQRLYFMRKLNSVHKKLKSFTESVLTFSFIAWFGSICVRDKNQMSHIVKVASKLIRTLQTSLTAIFEKQVLNKVRSILDCVSHPLHCNFEILPSGRRFRVPFYKCNRTRNSFVQAITLLNLHNTESQS